MLEVGGETLMGAMGSRKWSSKSLTISVALSAIMQEVSRLRKPRNCVNLCHSSPTGTSSVPSHCFKPSTGHVNTFLALSASDALSLEVLLSSAENITVCSAP